MNSSTQVPAARHRFDTLGARASLESEDVRDYRNFIAWAAATEAFPGTPKFKNVVEARAAFHRARVNERQR